MVPEVLDYHVKQDASLPVLHMTINQNVTAKTQRRQGERKQKELAGFTTTPCKLLRPLVLLLYATRLDVVDEYAGNECHAGNRGNQKKDERKPRITEDLE